MANVGERIKIVRVAEGMTQTDFAKIVASSQTALVDYERGVRPPPMSLLVILCEQFKRRPEWVLLGEGPEHIRDKFSHIEKALELTHSVLRPLLGETNPLKERQFALLILRYLDENSKISDAMAAHLAEVIVSSQ